ncbi:S41 family peptidase [Leeuwenhoekiella sp. MAR_2009_132]|uniref:S41 family peptidase n=1 Tax=Leeuwenhoekiella sp. MAR_2009_132 TaxID=1392489 RepID=UPI00048ECF03|nr:S41 family peptidase [Leeuwenhoekiella sp. MAR_2009_132]
MKYFLVVIFSFNIVNNYSQSTTKFNLDFEKQDLYENIARDWGTYGNYEITSDTTSVHTGKYSGRIVSNEDDTDGSLVYYIPAVYEGKTIRLDGFIKTKNVENGFAGLTLSIIGAGESLAFDNMKAADLKGTNDWNRYSITLPLPEGAEYFLIGGTLIGSGAVWFDDFTVTIDGEDIQSLSPKEIPIPKAKLDKEFDTGSEVEFPELTVDSLDKLTLLGKIWGFLKYHHPAIASGTYNWDYELFRILPEYLSTKNNLDRDTVLLNWIESFGEIEECQTCKETSELAFLKPDHSWFDNFFMTTELKSALNSIYANRHQGKGFYLGLDMAGRPDLLNEEIYKDVNLPDQGFQLLALYKYWNAVHYFFPYKYLTDEDWSKILKEYIPVFLKVKTRPEYELTVLKLIGEINDTHASPGGYSGFDLDKLRGDSYAPIRVRFVEEQLVVTHYYIKELKDSLDIKIGDVITQIDNVPVEEIVQNLNFLYPASNNETKLRDITNDILRSSKKKAVVKYISNKIEKEIELDLYPKSSLDLKWYDYDGENTYRILDGNIGYINLQMLTDSQIPKLKELLKDTKGIIIDIRRRPFGFFYNSLGSYFVSKPTPFVKVTYGNINNPGEFNFQNDYEILPSSETYEGKLVVLLNEDTQSSSEWATMAFKVGNNTTLIGSHTAGADGDISDLNLPFEITTYFSGIGVYYPDGRETQRIGILPDIEVKPSIEGIRQGRDELLEKAIEVINNE